MAEKAACTGRAFCDCRLRCSGAAAVSSEREARCSRGLGVVELSLRFQVAGDVCSSILSLFSLLPAPPPPPKIGNEEQQEKLLREWLDCCVTEGGVLVAMQKSSRRRNHPLVTQMVEKWLDRYRQIRPCTSLSDGEEDEDDDDE